MFTGIVTHIGEIAEIEDQHGDQRFWIKSALPLSKIETGASIACSGVCLTLVDKDGDKFAADVSAETVSKTIIGQWKTGTRINLETSLKAGDEIGGHLVSGHVDGVCLLEEIKIEGDSHRLTLKAPDELARYIAPKGSVTLDGVSLTVNEVNGTQGTHFGVNIIPHTWIHTTLGDRHTGDALNLEIDVIARYVARLMDTQSFKGLAA